jgi:hypothetical protein
MRITRGHLILFLLVLICVGVYIDQTAKKKIYLTPGTTLIETKAIPPVNVETAQPATNEPKPELDELENLSTNAANMIAIAGELWKKYKTEGMDVSDGQATLHYAKQLLNQKDYVNAIMYANEAIEKFKTARPAQANKPATRSAAAKRTNHKIIASKDLTYVIRHGDCLWNIAKMKRHYNDGWMWPVIWRRNKPAIPNPDLIYPDTKIVIPKKKPVKKES